MATIYVRKTGNDANNGTNPTTDAVLTISRADALASTGDAIDLGAGTWSEDITGNVAVTYQGAGMFETEIHLSSVVQLDYQNAPALRDLTYKFPSGTPYAQYAMRKIDIDRVYIDINFCTGIVLGTNSNIGDMIIKRSIITNGTTSNTFDIRRTITFQMLNSVFCCPSGVTSNSFVSAVLNNDSYIWNSIFYGYSDDTNASRLLNRIISSGGQRGYNIFNRNLTVTLESTEIENTDPLFEDVVAGNFELQAGSPAINFGVPYSE